MDLVYYNYDIKSDIMVLKLHTHASAHNCWLMFHRRQSPQCFRDIQQTTGQRFLQCNSIFEKLEEGQTLTRNDTTQFCQLRCPAYMLNLAKRIVQDCNFSDPLVRNCKILWYLQVVLVLLKVVFFSLSLITYAFLLYP